MTFLAAYRLGRAEGLSHDAAIDKADRVTWDTHFNYEADARPRLLQQDWLRVALTFRNFQINMLYRLFRDTHQAMHGRTAEERREARIQLGGITMSMMFHVGITGTWGYALTVALLGMFAPGGGDEIEEELKEGIISIFGPQIGGALIKGVPGQVPDGTPVPVLRRGTFNGRDWLQVAWGGHEGWIVAAYTAPIFAA